MESWPTTLLPPPDDTYSVDVETPTIRTEMDAGNIRQRARFSQDMRTISCRWIFTDTQWMIFQSWFAYKISNGADAFLADQWQGYGAEQCTCRFVDASYKSAYLGGKWNISALVELTDYQPAMNEEDFDTFLAMGIMDIDELADLESYASDIDAWAHTT